MTRTALQVLGIIVSAVVILVAINAVCVAIAYDKGYNAGWYAKVRTDVAE